MDSHNSQRKASTTARVVIIGGGTIGEALTSGLINAGHDPKQVCVVNRRQERSDELQQQYGVEVSTDAAAAARDADAIVISVKPKGVLSMLESIAGAVGEATVISMAAGISLGAMEQALSKSAAEGGAVARVMPNTPMLIGKGTSIVAYNQACGQTSKELVEGIMNAVGTVVEIDEGQMDAATAMSGSSPAYYYLVVEAMTDAGVSLGLPRETARALAVGSMEGSAGMMSTTGEDPAVLRGKVQSPGGTTIAAVRQLEEYGLRTAFYKATEACAQRSAELGAP